MDKIGNLFDSTVFRLFLVATLALYVVAQLSTPFIDHDPLIYSLIGRGIFQHSILPYDFAFDHKPLLLYFFYGTLSLFGNPFQEFAFFTLALLLASAWASHRIFLERRLSFPVTFSVTAAFVVGSISYSGNSELVYVPLEMLAVHAIVNSPGRPARLFVSAALTTIAFNTNYICAFALSPALLYGLWVSSPAMEAFIRRTVIYGLACIGFMTAVFVVFSLAGGDVAGYFEMQRLFLGGYSDVSLPPAKSFLIKMAVLSLPAVLPFLPLVPMAPQHRRFAIALSLLMAGSLLAFFINGKYFPHYLYMLAGPAAVIVLICCLDGARARAAMVVALLLLGLAYVGKFTLWADQERLDREAFLRPYAELGEIVGRERLMSMRASIIPLYYARSIPFQPLVWEDHAELLHGQRADDYYLEQLERNPAFVMTRPDWCTTGGAGWKACADLRARFDKISAFPGDGARQYGYELYRLRQP